MGNPLSEAPASRRHVPHSLSILARLLETKSVASGGGGWRGRVTWWHGVGGLVLADSIILVSVASTPRCEAESRCPYFESDFSTLSRVGIGWRDQEPPCGNDPLTFLRLAAAWFNLQPGLSGGGAFPHSLPSLCPLTLPVSRAGPTVVLDLPVTLSSTSSLFRTGGEPDEYKLKRVTRNLEMNVSRLAASPPLSPPPPSTTWGFHSLGAQVAPRRRAPHALRLSVRF